MGIPRFRMLFLLWMRKTGSLLLLLPLIFLLSKAILPLVTTKALQLVDNLRYLVGMEALYAAQAVDLRGNIRLGRYTQAAYDTIRKIIPSLDGLRPIQEDVQKAYTLIKSGKLLENLDDLAQCL